MKSVPRAVASDAFRKELRSLPVAVLIPQNKLEIT